MQHAFSFRTLIASLLLSLPSMRALATQWVPTDDTWIWIDQDSLTRENGLTFYFGGHSNAEGAIPSMESGPPNSAYDCATNEIYSQTKVDSGAYVWDESPRPAYAKYVPRFRQILCAQ